MSIWEQAYSAHLTIGGAQITWREIIGNAFGMASAIGGMRRKVWAWPVGIIGNMLLFTVFAGLVFGMDDRAPMLGQAGRQIFFIITSCTAGGCGARAAATARAVRPSRRTGRARASASATCSPGARASSSCTGSSR